MTAPAFDRGVLAPFIHLLVTVLAQFMRRLLKTVDSRIAYFQVMAAFALVNNHDLIFGMMADDA